MNNAALNIPVSYAGRLVDRQILCLVLGLSSKMLAKHNFVDKVDDGPDGFRCYKIFVGEIGFLIVGMFSKVNLLKF